MSESIVERAAAEAARAATLRRAAVTLRGQAGTLKFHPATGEKPRTSIRLTAALDAMTQVLNELQRRAAQRADDAAAATATASAGSVRQAHADADLGAQSTAAAIEVLRRVLADSDVATIDAPYGHGAPRRQHPGALCTIVAERAEGLARSLESLAILTANLTT
jgi:hypothetical protein